MVEREKFKILVKAMKAVYTRPEFIPDQNAFNVWYELLKDIDYEILSCAVQKHMMTSPYPPTIADIRNQSAAFIVKNEESSMSEMEAWDLVRVALSNSTYRAEEEFEKLPPLIQRAVGSPGAMRQMAAMDMDTVNSVEQSHFLRTYRAVVANEKERIKLSPAMRDLLDSVASGKPVAMIGEFGGAGGGAT